MKNRPEDQGKSFMFGKNCSGHFHFYHGKRGLDDWQKSKEIANRLGSNTWENKKEEPIDFCQLVKITSNHAQVQVDTFFKNTISYIKDFLDILKIHKNTSAMQQTL